MAKKKSILNDLVQSLKKYDKKVIYSKKIKEITKKLMGENYTDKKCYKLIYYLKNKGHILSIKKNIFYCKDPDTHVSLDIILEDWYRYILHTHAKTATKNDRYIGGLKALELCHNNFSIPENILLVSNEKQGFEKVVSDKEVQFKIYSHGGDSLFKKFRKFTSKKKLGKHSFPHAIIELAILETLYNISPLTEGYTNEYIKKLLKKNNHISPETLLHIMKLGKHHTSINRLYQLSKKVNSELANEILTIIKKTSFVLDV